MNSNRYRLKFSKNLGMLVPVSEITTAHRKSASGVSIANGEATPTAPPHHRFLKSRFAELILSTFAVLNVGFLSASIYAAGVLPTGGVLVNGNGGIVVNGQTMTIHQNTQVIGINWSTFNVGSGNTVVFQQPNSSAVAINQVLGNSGSTIYGNLQSNGQIFLVNPNGVLFAKDSQVNVGSLVASTANNVSQDANGNWIFSNMGPGAVINQGNIQSSKGGFVVLAGAQVTNQGQIQATQGSVALTAGQTVSLSLDNGQLINVQVTQGTLKALVDNQGLILADGGAVYLTASGVNTLLNTVVSNEGLVQARSIGQVNGRIILQGSGGDVLSTGIIDVSGQHAGEVGGTAILTGERVGLFDTTKIDASGVSGGGTVIIGGDKLGIVSNIVNVSLANQTSISNNAVIDISSSQGNGGYLETSGRTLNMQGQVNAGGATIAGRWLIDPTDITISSAASTASNTSNTWSGTNATDTVNNASIASALNSGANVTVTTASGNTSLGNLTVSSNIASTGSGNLTLIANNNLSINAAINLTGASGSVLTLNGGNITSNATGALNTSGGVVLFSSGSGSNLTGVIGGSGGLTNSGAGTVVLSGANTYTGTTNVTAGNLTWSGNPYFNIGRTTNIASGAVFDLLNSNNNLSGPIPNSTILGAGTFKLDGTTFINQTSNTNGLGYSQYINIAMAAGGLIDLEGTSKIINGGYQLINWTNNNASMFIAANATLDLWDGTTVNIDALNGSGSIVKSFVGGGSFPANTNLTIGVANGSGSFTGTIGSGVGNYQLNLVKAGTGTEVLSGANTYGGNTTVLAGNLTWSGNPYFNVGRVTNISSGAVLDLLNSNNTLNGPIPNSTILGAGTFKLDGNSTINQASNGTVNQANLNIAMSAGGLIDLEGTSRLTNGGWQFINWANNNASMCISANSTLDIWDGNSIYVDALTGSGRIQRGTSGSPTINMTIGVANGSGVFSGLIYGGSNTSAIGIIKVGTGTETFAGSEGYGGTTYINQGTLQIGNGGSTGTINVTPLIVNNANLVYNTTANVVLSNTTGTGNVTINTSGGNGMVTQAAGSVLNYSGTTNIQTGTGNVTLTNTNDSLAGQLTVISSGTLNVVNNIALNVGAINSSGPDTLITLAGNLNLNGNIQTSSGNVTLTAGANSSVAATSVANGNVTGGDVVKGTASNITAGSGSTVIIYTGNANSSLRTLVTNGTTSLYESYATGPGNGSANVSRALNIFDRVSPVLSINNATASNKVYDTTNVAFINGNITGGINGDVITNTATASFANAAVANGVAVNTSGASIGVATGNPNVTVTGYQFSTAPVGLTANITPAQVTITGVVVNNKVYDTTTNASINSSTATVALGNSSAANGSTVSKVFTNFTESATFNNASAGNAKTVNLSAVLTDTTNYTIVSQISNTTANITKAGVTVTAATVNNKVYDTTTNASVNSSTATVALGNATAANGSTVSQAFTNFTESATFNNATVGTGKTVNLNAVLSDTSNYTISSQIGSTTANISQAQVTITAALVNNKVYDTTTNATVNSSTATVALGNATAANGSTVSQAFTNFTESGTFNNATVGTAKTVNLNALLTDTTNYTIASQIGTATANISQAQVTIAAATVNNKIYDTTTNASVNSTTATVALGNATAANGSTVSQAFTNFTESAIFNNATVGTGKTVNLNAVLTDTTNYTIVSQIGNTTANISQAQVTISGVVVNNKVYDGTTNANVSSTTATVAIGNATSANGSTVSQAFTNFTESAIFNNATAGSVKTVNLSATLGDTTNYTIVSQIANTTANIAKANVTVTGAVVNNKVYDTTTNASVNTSTATVALGNATSANGATISQAFTNYTESASFNNASAGTAKAITLNGVVTDTTNYTISNQPSNITANITPAQVTITAASVNNKIYDATTNASVNSSTATVALGNATSANGSTISQAFTGFTESAVFNNATVGAAKTVNLNATLTDTTNYTIISQVNSSAANIAKANVTITAVTVNNKVYDTTTNASINSSSATVALGNASSANGSTISQAFNNFTESAVFNNASAGTGKTVNLSAVLTDSTNYSIVSQVSTATANITQAQVTVSNTVAANKTYDATTAANLSGTVVTVALGNPNAANGTLANTSTNNSLVSVSGVFANASAGNQTVLLTNTLADTTNYTLALASQLTTSATINKANLIAVVNNDAKFVTQNDNVGYSGVSYIGFVGGQNATTSDVTGGTITRTNSAVQSAGQYNGVLVLNGINSTNYTISTVAGNYTIVPANELLVRTANSSWVYGSDGNLSVVSAQYMSSNNSVISNVTLVSQSGNTFNYSDGVGGQAVFRLGPINPQSSTSGYLQAGSYQIGATNISATSANFNNNLVVVGGAVTVDQKALTLSTSNTSKTYDGTTAINNITLGISGVLNGDNVLASGTGAYASKNAGNNLSYSISAGSISGSDSQNYYIANPITSITPMTSNTGVINKANITQVNGISINDKVYDQTTNASLNGSSANFVGVITGDNLNISSANSQFNNATAGSLKPVSITNITLGGSDAGNYVLQNQTATSTANITPAQVTIISATVNNKVYDTTTNASVNSSSATVALGNANAANGSIVNQVFTNFTESASFSDAGAGNGKIVNLTGVLADSTNYTIAAQASSTTANISPAQVSVNGITVSNKNYDGSSSATIANNGVGTVLLGNASMPNGTTLSQGFNGYQISGASFTDGSVGSNKLVNFNLNLLDSTNYTWASGAQTWAYGNITNSASPYIQNGMLMINIPDGRTFGVMLNSGTLQVMNGTPNVLSPTSILYEPLANVSDRNINNAVGREAKSTPISLPVATAFRNEISQSIHVVNLGINDHLDSDIRK